MRGIFRHGMLWLAIYLIALQGILSGLAGPTLYAGPFEPAAIICHSEAAAGSPASSDIPHDPRNGGCSHCILCNAAPGANTPEPLLLNARVFTTAVPLPAPVSAVLPLGHPARAHLATGPPQAV